MKSFCKTKILDLILIEKLGLSLKSLFSGIIKNALRKLKQLSLRNEINVTKAEQYS